MKTVGSDLTAVSLKHCKTVLFVPVYRAITTAAAAAAVASSASSSCSVLPSYTDGVKVFLSLHST